MRRQLLVAGLWVGLASIAVCLTGCHGEGTPPVAALHVDTAQYGLLGDLNDNGTPDVGDAIAILRIAVALDANDALADCNRDGNVGVADAIVLLRCVVGVGDWPIGGGNGPGEQTIGPDGQTLLWVPGGSFMMGSNDGDSDERPTHRVTLDGFWIGQCEVTQAQYQAFCSVTGWMMPAGNDRGDDHPVAYLSWYAAKAYCDHYGYVLPTEAQWEYAARGPASSAYPWGDTWDESKCCNRDNLGPGGESFPVGSFPTGASWCRALDMAGNVEEWCADWYSEVYYMLSPELNPTGLKTGSVRVLRGGLWLDDSYFCRAALRDVSPPASSHYWQFGFRVSRSGP